MANKKQVAIVGAGTSGLMAIKCLKEEDFEPFCFEKSSYFGGRWKYHEENTEGVPSVMWNTTLLNSKELVAISDFPPEPEYPNYMKHNKVYQMFTEYANKFDLSRYITYNQEVMSVRRAGDYDRTGRWNLVVKDTRTGDFREYNFDAVMVCVGHLSLPNIPRFQRMDKFQGDVIHTHSVKKFQDFNNKRVCVVGTGNSALDATVEISHVANQVYLSARTPQWISTRHGPYGYPLDLGLFRWYHHHVLHKMFPLSWTDKFVKELFFSLRFSHSLFNIHPKRGVSSRDPAVSDCISSRLMNGSVILKKNIKEFTESGVIFEEEDAETEVDAVVLGTGYHWEFPFLDSSDFVTEGSKIHLYKCVYPPHLPFPTLGVFGFIVPLGPRFPCVEMQCRWFVHNLSGKGHLPRRTDMMKHIGKQYRENVERFGDSSRVFIHVDFMHYTEDIASEIGACPSMLELLQSDFQLFTACVFGPYVPYRFRLVGPHSWSGARKAILEVDQRMKYPLQGKMAFMKKSNSYLKYYFISSVTIIVFYLYQNNLIFINHENILILQSIYNVLKAIVTNFLKTGTIIYNKLIMYFIINSKRRLEYFIGKCQTLKNIHQ